MAKVFTLEPIGATLLIFDGAEIAFEHLIPRAEFKSLVDYIDYDSIRQLSYEPEKGYYHIIDSTGALTAFDGPEGHDAFLQIEANLDSLTNIFKDHLAAEEAKLEALYAANPA